MIDGEKERLVVIKLLHTLIWAFFVFILLYILFAVSIGNIDSYLWMCIAVICLEGLLLVVNKGKCPLTFVAAKYSQNQEVGFDIFLPKWLAKNNKVIFTTLFFIEIGVLCFKLLG